MTEDAAALPVERSVALTQPARFAFDADQIATIKRTVAKDCNDSEFAMFMEVVGRYKLDPFTKQIYAAKMPGRDGGPGAITIIVGRDGLNALADRDPTFRGMSGGVVHEHDRFYAEFTEDDLWKVRHVAAHDESGKPIDGGKTLGAWAKVKRQGRMETYIYVAMSDYNTGKNAWRKYADQMILKVAESAALRRAFPIKLPTGLNVIGEEEYESVVTQGDPVRATEDQINWGPDPTFALYLQMLVAEANRVKPDSFRPQKMAFKLAPADNAERVKIAHALEAFITSHGGAVPTPEQVQERLRPDGDPSAPTEEEIQEAEVVGGGEAA